MFVLLHCLKRQYAWIMFACIVTLTSGSTILSMVLQQKSHMSSNKAILDKLIERGHTVYTILGSEFGKVRNLQEGMKKDGHNILWFKQNTDKLHSTAIDSQLADLLNKQYISLFDMKDQIVKANEIIENDCVDMFSDVEFMQQLREIKFDLVYVQVFQSSPCTVLLPHNLSLPYVVSSPIAVPWMFGVPNLPSFVPTVPLPFTSEMTFTQRLINLACYFIIRYNPLSNQRTTDSLLATYAPDNTGWSTLINKGMLYIVPRDYILGGPQPVMPNVVLLPGISYKEAKTLNQGFVKVVNESESGVIVVSFGSMGSKLPIRHTQKLLDAFRLVSETFIFSHAEDEALDVPSNVKMVSWIPQNDILGHPKTKLFISHAGANGLIESIYHGVPIITIPLFGDQFHNAVRIESRGIGISLVLNEFTTNDLVSAITKILNDDSYSKTTKLWSAILKDLPKHPTDYAADKIEHVLKFGGDHLRSHAVNMPLYQFLMFDILFFIVILLIVLFIFGWCLFKTVLKCFCRVKSEIKSKQA